MRISSLLKRELQPWLRFLATVGLDPAECVHPSRRYAKAHGDVSATDPTGVYHVSTSALPWLLAHQMAHSQSRNQQKIATSLLTGVLRELLAVEDVYDFWDDVMSIETDLLSMCGVRAVPGAPACSHVSDLLTPMSTTSDNAHSQLAGALSKLYLLSTECPTLSKWLETVASGPHKLLNRRILAGEYPSDMLRDDSPLGCEEHIALGW